MKVKTTKKSIKENSKALFSVGYCNLQHLLAYKEPFAYSERAEGWSCDYYDLDGVVISTGYAPTGDRIPYEITKRYDNEARQIVNNFDLSHEEIVEKLDDLIRDFRDEILRA